MAIVETKVFYYIVRDGAVTVSVYIGEGQVGGWAIVRGDQVVAKGSAPEKTAVGTGTQLRGSHLVVTTSVQDRSTESDRLSVTVVVEGGQRRENFPHDRVGQPGESALYTSVIVFQ